jgi:hypothetical protein
MTREQFVKPLFGASEGHGRPTSNPPIGGCWITFSGGKKFAGGQQASGPFSNEDNFPARVLALCLFVKRDTTNTLDQSQVKTIVPQLPG